MRSSASCALNTCGEWSGPDGAVPPMTRRPRPRTARTEVSKVSNDRRVRLVSIHDVLTDRERNSDPTVSEERPTELAVVEQVDAERPQPLSSCGLRPRSSGTTRGTNRQK